MAVVVLDEVGLAEDSPNLPLKVLHPLLEDGTEGAKKDFTYQVFFYYDVLINDKSLLSSLTDYLSPGAGGLYWYIQLGS